MAVNDPDTLLKKIDKKGMFGDVIISIVVHALIIGLTSFGLYASWAKWGVHSPSKIKTLEKAAAKEAEKQKQEELAAAAKAHEATNDVQKAGQKVQKTTPEASVAPTKQDDAPAQLPLDKQVSEPPKTFDLNEIDL